jgi:nucleoside-diphosphate-sugar epimerase
MLNIAILGATSHIAKGLIFNLAGRGDCRLELFARSPERVADFLKMFISSPQASLSVHGFGEFGRGDHDVVINCVGIRKSVDFAAQLPSVLKLTEDHDNLILTYLAGHTGALYINFSSGAAYGSDFREPASETTSAQWRINHLERAEYYGVAKLNAEVKHRALDKLNIVDLRLFGYFSRFIDLSDQYLLAEIVACLKEEREFITDQYNVVRDYVHHQDLYSLVESCLQRRTLNDAFDVYSLAPVAKNDLLTYCRDNFGLRYSVRGGFDAASATGRKEKYYSVNKKAEQLGYAPRYTSLAGFAGEAEQLLKQTKG